MTCIILINEIKYKSLFLFRKDELWMSNESNKNSSEIYRQERKERLAKAAEKKEKKNISSNKKFKKNAVGISISVVAIVLITTFFLNFFGVPKRMQTALITSNGTKISVAEYEYYYRYFMTMHHNTSAQYEAQYGQYYGAGAGLMMTGYDANKTPENQKYTIDKLDEKKYGKEPTWADFFENSALESCYVNRSLATESKKAGFKIEADDKKEINDYIEEIRGVATENDYSLDAYLRQNFGKGMNEKLLRDLFETQFLAQKFLDKNQDDLEKKITDDVILKHYEKNINDYNVCDLRIFNLSSNSQIASEEDEKETSKEELEAKTKAESNKVKENAQKMFDAVSNEETFISSAYTYANETSKESYKEDDATLMKNVKIADLEENISKDAAQWVYNNERANGDKKLFTEENQDGSVSCSVVYVIKTPYRDDTLQPVDVRHILIAFNDNSEEGQQAEVTPELEAKKLKEAEALLEKWKSADATEKSFAELAKKKSDDSGSAQEGGLISDITKDSNYVKPFIDWCYEDARKVGDTGIVKSTYGYHIMYCSSISDKTGWQNDIASSIVKEKFEKFFDDFAEKEEKNIKTKDKTLAKVRKSMEKVAGKMIANA